MIDVHPPHEATHTWTDFFIHIATIVVGLLIAVGLEQTVEAIHHAHQRHQLEEDLHTESEHVHAAMQNNLHTYAIERNWLLALRQDVDTMRRGSGQPKLSYRPRPATDPDDPAHPPLILRWPPDGVWQTAKLGGLVPLLPSSQARIYSSVAYQQELLVSAIRAWIAEQTNLIAFEMQFNDGQPTSSPVLSRMTPAQLDQYSALLSRNLALRDTVVNRSKIYDVVESSILDGVTSTEQIAQRLRDQHVDFER